jgi:AcrR family transcriptional regulator
MKPPTKAPPKAAPRVSRARSTEASTLPTESQLAPNRRHNILRAAERLFARQGFHGVSVRDIADEAGVPLALVGYYFGPKLSLYHELFRDRAGYIQERLAALAMAQQNAAPDRLLEEIVTAWVLPVFKVAATADGRNFLLMLKRAMHEHIPEDESVVRDLFDPLAFAFIDALQAALPQAPRTTVTWCYQFSLGALLHAATDSRVERLSLGESSVSDTEVSVPVLIRFITEGFRQTCGAPRTH